jgi:hypothetical protein
MEDIGVNDIFDKEHLFLKFFIILVRDILPIKHGDNQPDLIFKGKEFAVDSSGKFKCSLPTDNNVMQFVRIGSETIDSFDGLATKRGIGLIEFPDEISVCPVIKDSLFDDFGSVELNFVVVSANKIVESLVL